MKSISIPRRLPAGKGVVGLDWPGCINSGAAPVLLHSKSARQYLGKPFLVAGKFLFDFQLGESIRLAMLGKRSREMKRWKFRAFKTYKAARSEFEKRNAIIRRMYDDLRDKTRIARDPSAPLEQRIEAGFALSDNGML
jgi:hypothetical protein